MGGTTTQRFHWYTGSETSAGVVRDRLGGDAHVRLAREHLLANLRGIPLVQHQLDFRILALERRHGLRQRVARLGVGCGDGQRAELIVRELLARAPQVRASARMRSAMAMTALPGSVMVTRRLPWRTNTFTELVLERADLLRDAGLRRVQRLRRLGDIQPAPGDFGEAAQLLELHTFTNSGSGCELRSHVPAHAIRTLTPNSYIHPCYEILIQ